MNPEMQKLIDLSNKSEPENGSTSKLDHLVVPPRNKTEVISDWEAVSLKLKRLEKIDADLIIKLGSIQTFLVADDGFQLGIHGEGPVVTVGGLEYPQESTTF